MFLFIEGEREENSAKYGFISLVLSAVKKNAREVQLGRYLADACVHKWSMEMAGNGVDSKWLLTGRTEGKTGVHEDKAGISSVRMQAHAWRCFEGDACASGKAGVASSMHGADFWHVMVAGLRAGRRLEEQGKRQVERCKERKWRSMCAAGSLASWSGRSRHECRRICSSWSKAGAGSEESCRLEQEQNIYIYIQAGTQAIMVVVVRKAAAGCKEEELALRLGKESSCWQEHSARLGTWKQSLALLGFPSSIRKRNT